ncbi:hypothetical protein Pan258_46480 [Symmachiella dynata]|uniref:hypothetical protein n=1 Tax=Symmachiella dynata TaxID=2527995 RepID=UPI001189B211|nr:hypothetical protein [Symmachiella dynata]QDT50569.1 hypothetical protein Pan258_46480 [Symmachiella dynata]
MKMCLLVALVFACGFPALANAQTWTSPDGIMSLTPPDENEFQAVPNPPEPFIVLWLSNDDTKRFGVIKMDIPREMKISQSSVEEGLAEEVGAEVTRLPTKHVAGHEVLNMTGTSPSIDIRQAVFRHDDAAYKLMAATVGAPPDDEAINQFIDSLSIVAQAPTRPNKRIERGMGENADAHNFSKRIGGFGLLLAIGLVIYFLLRRIGKRRT